MHVYTIKTKITLNPARQHKLSQKLRGEHPLEGSQGCSGVCAGLAGVSALRLGEPNPVGGLSERTSDSQVESESVSAICCEESPFFFWPCASRLLTYAVHPSEPNHLGRARTSRTTNRCKRCACKLRLLPQRANGRFSPETE